MSDGMPRPDLLGHLLQRAARLPSAMARIQHLLAWLVPLVQGDAGVALLGRGPDTRVVATRGLAADELAEFLRAPGATGQSLSDHVVATGHSLLQEPRSDSGFGPSSRLEELTVGTLIVVPLVGAHGPVGIVAVAWRVPQSAAGERVAFLEAAGRRFGDSLALAS